MTRIVLSDGARSARGKSLGSLAGVCNTETLAKLEFPYEQYGASRLNRYEVFEPDESDAILEDSF